MSVIARGLSEQLPPAQRGQGINVVPLSLYVVGPQSRLALWLLGAAVFCVFLIAAANVASLSLARSTARTREMAVRAALGANTGRIVRQLLTESLVLAALSGLLGTLLAIGGIDLIRAFGPDNLPRLRDVGLDARVLGWALGMSVLAGILVGLAPSMTTMRRDLRPSGEESCRSVSSGPASRRIRRALVVAEFAIAIVLLAGAGLLFRTWWHVTRIDPGFRPERVLVMGITPPSSIGVPAQRTDLYYRVLERIQAVPGVERAGIIDDLFSDNPRELVVTIERNEGTVTERLRFTRDEISADLFRALGTPLVRGRFFSPADRPGAPLVAIVNNAMAQRSWPGQDPVGRRLTLGRRMRTPRGTPWWAWSATCGGRGWSARRCRRCSCRWRRIIPRGTQISSSGPRRTIRSPSPAPFARPCARWSRTPRSSTSRRWSSGSAPISRSAASRRRSWPASPSSRC
jgi:predicted permease